MIDIIITDRKAGNWEVMGEALKGVPKKYAALIVLSAVLFMITPLFGIFRESPYPPMYFMLVHVIFTCSWLVSMFVSKKIEIELGARANVANPNYALGLAELARAVALLETEENFYYDRLTITSTGGPCEVYAIELETFDRILKAKDILFPRKEDKEEEQ